MKAEIITGGAKVGEISFSEGSLTIKCDDQALKDRIYLHLTSPEPKEEQEVKKLDAVKGTEPGTPDYFKATLEFIDEMEKDVEFKFVG
jgi:hypothetical protein